MKAAVVKRLTICSLLVPQWDGKVSAVKNRNYISDSLLVDPVLFRQENGYLEVRSESRTVLVPDRELQRSQLDPG